MMWEAKPDTKWTGAELGRAMLYCARQHSKTSERQTYADCCAWWRGGDDLNVRIYLDKGCWHDIKDGTQGNASSAASLWMGMSLPEFMEVYGGAPVAPRKPQEENRKVSKAEWARFWEDRLISPARRQLGCEWAWGRRVPPYYRDSSLLAVDRDDEEGMPEHVAKWWHRNVGPSVAAPMRELVSGEIAGLHLRGQDGGKMHVKCSALKDKHGRPCVYGWGQGCRLPRIVLTEGLADTVLAEAAVWEHSCTVLGAISLQDLPPLAEAMVEINPSAKYLLIYHVDRPQELKTSLAAYRKLKDAGVDVQAYHLDGGVDVPRGFDLSDLVERDGFDVATAPIARWLGGRGL